MPIKRLVSFRKLRPQEGGQYFVCESYFNIPYLIRPVGTATSTACLTLQCLFDNVTLIKTKKETKQNRCFLAAIILCHCGGRRAGIMYFTKTKAQIATRIVFVAIICWIAVQKMTRLRNYRQNSVFKPSVDPKEQPTLRTKPPLINKNAKVNNSKNVQATSNSKTRSIPMYSDKVIGPLPYNFTLTNGHVCMQNATSQRDVFLLILVKCRPGGSSRRALIRKTWGGVRKVDGRQTLTMFLLGKAVSSAQNAMVTNENSQHHDIIQSDFVDSYLNLTHKTMMGWRWASTFCPGAEYVASADDDVLLNVYNIVRRLAKRPRTKYGEGYLLVGKKPNRKKNTKWHTTEKLYPEPTYPPHFLGPCYVLSGDVVAWFHKESPHVRFLPWDDVYVGMILNRLEVTLTNVPRYIVFANSYKAIEAALDEGQAVLVGNQNLLIKDSGGGEALLKMWENLTQKHNAENHTREY
ncbi:beta-1,3-galactosyltransferase 2-like [Acanthaster planci]|uniref:Hexosyltransferase n=1 Tax=Acanthaster planci TaxID=133434 RepID=A0A8B7XMX9_ACAPL|nr:beta-1,3-galactosyltransferase 2-like [Acanthaster planci]